jgi:hypothetical protein
MPKEQFGVAVDEEIVREVAELVSECDDLGVSRSERVKVEQRGESLQGV